MISVYDERFKEYGRIKREYDITELVRLAKRGAFEGLYGENIRL